ncbi:GNAT family N-acetyltransferase [Vibrio rhodolitus]|uniref:GNAT family N-acetyltransferase n=1 Tax=Vibrio rhodolitus TaxID=2231649 RepID=UPI000E0C9301|nr:N-acetyltransferase [Vibrio rhodolitus]
MTVTYRSIEQHEFAMMAQLEQQCFGAHALPDFFFRQSYDCWPKGCFAAFREQEMLAFLILAQSETPDIGWILSVAVSPELQGQGIGRKLLTHLLEQQGYARVRLTVDPENPAALRLYQSLGFSKITEEADYFGPNQTRWVMEYSPNLSI